MMLTDYYPFGMAMVGRTWESSGYRYGFQGQEGDNEVVGEGNAYAYTYRMSDARLGRFWSVDPLSARFPFFSPYSFSGNCVINSVELEGLEPKSVVQNGHFTKAAARLLYIVSGVAEDRIRQVAIIPRAPYLLFNAPWYSIEKGGGAITTKDLMIFTQNYFSTTEYGENSFGGNANNGIISWLRLGSHEVGHLPQADFTGNDLLLYFYFHAAAYWEGRNENAKNFHDRSILEADAELGRQNFNKWIDGRIGAGKINDIFMDETLSDEERADKVQGLFVGWYVDQIGVCDKNISNFQKKLESLNPFDNSPRNAQQIESLNGQIRSEMEKRDQIQKEWEDQKWAK